jgi:hypothetical protein
MEDGVIYPEGYELCRDVYCFKCAAGGWEMHPWIGASTDLSEVW